MLWREPIYVPEKTVNGEVVIPAMQMEPIGAHSSDGREARAAYSTAPTAAELMHAMLTSKDFRGNVHDALFLAEWTSTFLEERQPKKGEVVPRGFYPVRAYVKPTKLVHPRTKASALEIECDNVIDTLVPEEGWFVPENGDLFSADTGLPLRVVDNPEEAVWQLSESMPYERAISIASMWKYEEGYRAGQVYRANGIHPIGAFRFRINSIWSRRDDYQYFKVREIRLGDENF